MCLGRVNDHKRTDEANLLAGEFNGVPGRSEQPNQ